MKTKILLRTMRYIIAVIIGTAFLGLVVSVFSYEVTITHDDTFYTQDLIELPFELLIPDWTDSEEFENNMQGSMQVIERQQECELYQVKGYYRCQIRYRNVFQEFFGLH